MSRFFARFALLLFLPCSSACAANQKPMSAQSNSPSDAPPAETAPAVKAPERAAADGSKAALPMVKVSLSKDDPDLHAIESKGEIYEFFLFLDGQVVRGFQFGMTIEGGELMGYVVDTEKPWATLPMGGYPGTMMQAAAGDKCFEPPAYAGKLLVKPHKPGGKVVVDVMPSTTGEIATLLNCDLSADYTLHAYPAAVNGKPPKDHEVRGLEEESVSYPGVVPETNIPSSVPPKEGKHEDSSDSD